MKSDPQKRAAKPPATSPGDGILDASPERAAELLHAIIQGTAATTG